MAKGKVTLAPADISAKWGQRLKSAGPDIQKGIAAVTESPMAKAAANIEKMRQGFNAAIDSGRTAAALQASPLADWKDKTTKKVGERLSGGVDAAMPKRRAFDTYLVGTLNTILPQIQAMPNMTLEDSVGRVRALMQHMHDNPYKKGA